jgi:NarL family two-component system sensor histidine kinase LiaS
MERVRIAEEIHNGAAQSAYVISLGLESCACLSKNASPELKEKITAIQRMAKQAVWELRYPINLGQLFEGRDLAKALETHVNNFKTITSIPATFSLSGASRRMPVMTAQRLFSVAHNALANVYRHAGASNVSVALAFQNGTLSLSIQDDGVGLPSQDIDTYAGHGLRNIRRVAEELRGKAEFSGTRGKGTLISCAIPLPAP